MHKPSSSNISVFTSNSYPTHFAGPTTQGNLFGEHPTVNSASASFESSMSYVGPLPQSDPNVSSAFTSYATNSYLPTLMTSTLPSGSTPLRSSGPSIAMHSQYNSSNDTSGLGKRDLHPIDLNCEPERKKARQNSPDRVSPSQQSESYLPPCVDPSNLLSPSFKDSSFPSLDTTASVPESPATTYGHVIPEPESGADWSITYNSEVKRAFDVSLVCPLQVGHPISCMAFSKDGKRLAVGLDGDVTITIYDVETGEKMWLVARCSFGYADQFLVAVY
jgi:hypothetical protein